MGVLVIKSWKAESKSFDEKGTHVHITGRRSGLIGFILARAGIDSTTILKVSSERLELTWASLSGTEHRVVPLQNICSTYYGFSKPWKFAVSLWVALTLAAFALTNILIEEGDTFEGFIFLGWASLLSAVACAVYFILNRRLTLGFVELSGVVNAIAFKRSVIENINIDHADAKNVGMIVQRCIDYKLRSLSN